MSDNILRGVCDDFIHWCKHGDNIYSFIDKGAFHLLCEGDEITKKKAINDLVENIATYIFDTYSFKNCKSLREVQKFFQVNTSSLNIVVYNWLTTLPGYDTCFNFIGSKESLELFYNHAHDIFLNQMRVLDKMHDLNLKIGRDANVNIMLSCTSTIFHDGRPKHSVEECLSPIPLILYDKPMDPMDRKPPIDIANAILHNMLKISNYFRAYNVKGIRILLESYEDIRKDITNIQNEIDSPIDTISSHRISISTLKSMDELNKASKYMKKEIDEHFPDFCDRAYRQIIMNWEQLN